MVDRRPKTALGSGRSAGFTLVELAVVVAIIGVLASTAGVQYFKTLQRVRVARAIIELRAIAAEFDPMGDEFATLPASLAEAGIVRNDPWGRPYRYLRIEGALPSALASADRGLPSVGANQGSVAGQTTGPTQGSVAHDDTGASQDTGGVMGDARKDRFLVPINSDFDLYSVGPDGKTQAPLSNPDSLDDVIRAADGGFYGLAENF